MNGCANSNSSKQPIGKKLLENIGANATTTVLIAIFQLISVPVFLNTWGIQVYAMWIAVSTLCAYFQLSDLGLNTATTNLYVIAYTQRDYSRCSRLLVTNVLFLIVAFTAVAVCLIPLTLSGVLGRLLNINAGPAYLLILVLLLLMQIAVGMMNNLLSAIYRGAALVARGVMIDNVIRLCEYGSALLVVWFGGSPLVCVGSIVIAKAFGLLFKWRDATRIFPIAVIRQNASLEELRNSTRPSLYFVVFPLANALGLQGPIIVFSHWLGATAVVVFTTTRTLVGCARAITDVLQRSTSPEMTIAFAHNDVFRLQMLHRGTFAASFCVSLFGAITILVLGPFVYSHWAASAQWNFYLALVFCVSLLITSVSGASTALLLSINEHERLAQIAVLAAIVQLLGTLGVARAGGSITQAAAAMLIGDVIMMSYAFRKAVVTTHDTIEGFWIRSFGEVPALLYRFRRVIG